MNWLENQFKNKDINLMVKKSIQYSLTLNEQTESNFLKLYIQSFCWYTMQILSSLLHLLWIARFLHDNSSRRWVHFVSKSQAVN